MSIFPSVESILLEIHQSLGCAPYQTKKKEDFATGQMRLANYPEMFRGTYGAICDALGLDPIAHDDALANLVEFANAYKSLELNIWTFGADQRQVLWHLLGYFLVPGLARYAANWNLVEALDKGMPGGRFWYLPTPQEKDGKLYLRLPVAQVVDWLLDLLDMPVENFANERTTVLKDADDKKSESLIRSLYYWRNETTPTPATFQKYFPDGLDVNFGGAFVLDSSLPPPEQFRAAIHFVERKNLSAENLRAEIPMTASGRLEAVFDGIADDDEKALFVDLISERYAPPSPQTIRQRLLFARAVQDGYGRLLKFVCPGVELRCADHKQNKLLQLFALYQLVYNLTIDARRHCGGQGEAAENAWFEEHLPPWDARGLCLSVLPSRRETSIIEVAMRLKRYFSEVEPDAELEDHLGLDEASVLEIVKRDTERLKTLGEDLLAEVTLVDRLRTASPWRTLQAETRYWVVSQVARNANLSPRAQETAIQRLCELASTPAQQVEAIRLELDRLFNIARTCQPRDTRNRVEKLLDEAEASPGYEIWKADVLQYRAKHLLACNDFDAALKLFRQALEAGRQRCYGPLRGEVARDCFAVEVANRKLIPGNHEKYFREMLMGGMVENQEIPPIEETARWASDYFWEKLYRPYPGTERLQQKMLTEFDKILRALMPFLINNDKAKLLDWIQYNRKLLKSCLPDVDGNSVLMQLIKMRTAFVRRLPIMQQLVPPELQEDQRRFEAMVTHLRQFIGLVAKEAPGEQIRLADLKGQTPIMLMAEDGDTELVKIMLDAGADVDQQDYRGVTALHSAIKSRVDSCVDELLDHPCLLSNKTDDGQSVLHTAAKFGNLHAAKRVLQLAPSLAWERDSFGMTPLEAVEYLLEHPDTLQALARRQTANGNRGVLKRELEDLLCVLEQADTP